MAKSNSKFYKRETTPEVEVYAGIRYMTGGGVRIETRGRNQEGYLYLDLDRTESLYLAEKILSTIHEQDALTAKLYTELKAKQPS